jgi:hypothetical protein
VEHTCNPVEQENSNSLHSALLYQGQKFSSSSHIEENITLKKTLRLGFVKKYLHAKHFVFPGLIKAS